MLLALHRIRAAPESDGNGRHAFTFSLENVQRLATDSRSVESEEFNFAGTDWSLVCARKDDHHLGAFLKWKYPDSCSAGNVWAKASFTITIVHQYESEKSVSFTSQRQQAFNSSQAVLGKSRLLALGEFLDPASGFLDGTAKQAMVELTMAGGSFGYEATVDVSPKNRSRKNAGGIYFDSAPFTLANHRWYLRFYTKKLNSGGLPAVYLYLHGGSQGISVDLSFTLSLADATTELLGYEFGEGAKFDGFGKTLPDLFPNPDKLTELNVAVDITRVAVYKMVFLKPPSLQPPTTTAAAAYNARSLQRKSPIFFNRPPSRGVSRDRMSTPTFNLADASQRFFQDQYGNPWKVEISREASLESLVNSTLVVFEKGVYHFPNNKSKLVCVQVSVMSQNLEVARDVSARHPSLVCYFSNSLEEKGYPVSLPVSQERLASEKYGYSNENGEVLIRIDFVSIQTSSFPIRSGPKFDYLINHRMEKKSAGNGNIPKSLLEAESPREAFASRSSISILEERPPSDSSSIQFLLSPKSDSDAAKSVESLLSSGQSDSGGQNNHIKDHHHHHNKTENSTFLVELLRTLGAETGKFPWRMGAENQQRETGKVPWTRRVKVQSPEQQKETLKFQAASLLYDEVALVRHARCSAKDELRQKDMVDVLIKFLEQKFPLRLSEVVVLGSLGNGTNASSRCDVDLVAISPDLPRTGHETWLLAFQQALRQELEQSSICDAGVSSLNCTNFATGRYSVQFTCDDLLHVDIWVTADWSSAETHPLEAMRDLRFPAGARDHPSLLETAKKQTEEWRFYEMCSARGKAKFFEEISAETKDIIRIVKHWRNSISWMQYDHRPDSFLISLLVIKAAQDVNEHSLRSVLQMVAKYLKEPELRITWDRFYGREVPRVFKFDPPTPLVEDPTNPAINVAQRLKYWGQFRAKYMNWLDSLKIPH